MGVSIVRSVRWTTSDANRNYSRALEWPTLTTQWFPDKKQYAYIPSFNLAPGSLPLGWKEVSLQNIVSSLAQTLRILKMNMSRLRE